jgi:hypothetical protein
MSLNILRGALRAMRCCKTALQVATHFLAFGVARILRRLAFGAASIALIYAAFRCIPPRYKSQWFSKFLTRIDHVALRTDFRERELAPLRVSLVNPHADCAALRSCADNFINEFAHANALPIYSVSLSPKDKWKGIAGNRYYYFEKDLRMEFQSDDIPQNALIKLIDVDYYVSRQDLAYYITRGRCIAMYTIMPEHLSYRTDESVVTIDANGVLTETQVGSAPYSHSLWDWRRDYVTVIAYPTISFDGDYTPAKMTHSYVDYKRIGPNRYVVLLTPVFTTGIFGALLWCLIGDISLLSRWKPIHQNGVSMIYGNDNVILAYPNSFTEHALTHEQYNECAHIDTTKISPGTIQRIRSSSDTQYELMSMLKDLQHALPKTIPNLFTNKEVRSYKIEWFGTNDELKVKGRCMFTPLIDGCFAAASGPSGDKASVLGRHTKPQENSSHIPTKYYDEIPNFVSCLVIYAPGKLHPLHPDEVFEQASAAQRKKFENSDEGPHSERHKSIQKTESYPEPKWPRAIYAVDPNNVERLLRFVKPAVAYLKEHAHWYMFGKHPIKIAETLNELANDPYGVMIEGDFSKYDGTQVTIFVDLMTAVLCGLFDAVYHDEIRQLRYELSYAVFVTEYGVKFNSKDSQKSGSAATSKDNTVSHAYVQYCHFRNIGFSIPDAYARVRMCAGDDGVTRTSDPDNYVKTCTDLRLVLKCNIRQPGESVSFLGRIYPDPGVSGRSFFDPMRALSKFHFSDTTDPHVDVNVLAWRKSAGYYITDAGNFIGHIARHILEITQHGKTEIIERREWLKDILPENSEMTSQNLFDKFDNNPIFPGFITHPVRLTLDHVVAEDWYPRSCSSEFIPTKHMELDPCFKYFCQQIEMDETIVLHWYLRFLATSSLEEFETLLRVDVKQEDVPVAMTIDNQTFGPPLVRAPIVPDPVYPVCFYMFKYKNCKRGDKCKFDHDMKNKCVDFCLNKCKRSPCKFEHVPLSAKV